MNLDAATLAMQSASRAIRALSRVPAQASARAATELRAVVVEQEAEAREVDPYERPWKPLAASTVRTKRGDTRILRDTGKMLDELEIRPMSGAGLSLTFGAPQSAFHQIGTKNMPARPLIPTGPLPRSWSEAIEQAIDAELSEVAL